MTKQELHTAFGNWIAEQGYKVLSHRVGIYDYDGGWTISVDELKEKYLSHLENLLQDYE